MNDQARILKATLPFAIMTKLLFFDFISVTIPIMPYGASLSPLKHE